MIEADPTKVKTETGPVAPIPALKTTRVPAQEAEEVSQEGADGPTRALEAL